MDKVSIRRLQIIDILNSHDKWFNTNELAATLNCAEKTIRSDLQFINSIFPKGWQIETVKGKGIYFHRPINSCINQIRSLFIKSSFSLQVIMLIEIKKISYISDLSKALYTHHNTIYSILDRVEILLKSYGLSLRRNPLKIVGSEAQKRILCCDVLEGLFSSNNNWPYENISFAFIKNIVLQSTEKYSVFLYPSSTLKYINYIGTMLHRIDYQIDLDFSKLNKIRDSKFFLISTEICDQIENKYNRLISYNEVIALTLFISTLPYICNTESEKDEVLALFQTQPNSFYKQLHVFVNMLEEELCLSLKDHKEFIFTLQKQFKSFSLILYISNQIQPPNSIVTYVQKHYPELYRKVDLVFKKWSRHFSYDGEVSQASIAKVCLNIQAVIISLSPNEKRVLLLTSEGQGIYHYIKARLKQEFGNKIKFVEYKKNGFSSDHLKSLGLDLIISDFQLDIDTLPIANINSTLTQRDIKQISQFLS